VHGPRRQDRILQRRSVPAPLVLLRAFASILINYSCSDFLPSRIDVDRLASLSIWLLAVVSTAIYTTNSLAMLSLADAGTPKSGVLLTAYQSLSDGARPIFAVRCCASALIHSANIASGGKMAEV
jgi:hypothetical protein